MASLLRVLTANLWNGLADGQALADVVDARQVDVLAVQELAPDQCEPIAAALPFGLLEPCDRHMGMGIALRRPAKVDRLPLVHRDARTVQLDPAAWPGLPRPVEIVNVHIIAPTDPRYWRRPWLRGRQLHGLVDYLDATPGTTRVVVGDFNATPAWPVYWQVARRLRDAARVHGKSVGRRPRATWPTGLGPLRLLRIDHCFAHGLAVERVETVRIRGSDHFALLAELTID